MADRTPRRSMVGAPPNARPSRTPKPTARAASARKRRDLDDEPLTPTNDANNASTQGSDNSDDSVSEEIDQKDAFSSQPRRKRRKKLSDYTIRRRAKDLAKAKAAELRKKMIDEGLIDEEEEEEPEKEPEKEDTPEPEMKPAEVRRYSSFQLFCDHLLRKLMAKDPEEYFAFPVTQSMAPDYHNIIKKPMDFSMMRQKIEDDKYKDVSRDYFNKVLAYNHPNTVYHLAATRLSQIVRFYFSEQYLRYVFHMMKFARDIPVKLLGLPAAAPKPKPENIRKQGLCDPITGKDLLKKMSATDSARMTTRVPQLKKSHLSFISNKDGATVLNIVTGDADEKKTRLIDIVGPLDEGTPGLLQPIDSRAPQNTQTPISYLNYGPYSSFAPHYDSTWALMNKRDSDLLLRTYGDRANSADVISLRNMVLNTNEYMLKAVDDLLDDLTDGEHSRTIKQLERKTEKMPSMLADEDLPATLTAIETLSNFGFDTSFVADIRAKTHIKKELTLQEELNIQGQGILDMAEIQRRRLSIVPPLTLTKVGGPGIVETQLAVKVASQLVETVSTFTTPSQIVSAPTLHNAMGINDPAYVESDDILNEFFF